MIDWDAREVVKEVSTWDYQACLFDHFGWGDMFYASHMYGRFAIYHDINVKVSHDE